MRIEYIDGKIDDFKPDGEVKIRQYTITFTQSMSYLIIPLINIRKIIK